MNVFSRNGTASNRLAILKGMYFIALIAVVFWLFVIEETISIGILIYVCSLPWLARLSLRSVRVLAGVLVLMWCLGGMVFGDFVYFLSVALSCGLLFAATFVPNPGRVERIALRSGAVIAGLLSVALITLRIDEPDPHDARGFFLFLSLTTHWVVALLTLAVISVSYLCRIMIGKMRSTRSRL